MRNLDRVVRDVVASCNVCIATKYYTRATAGGQYYDLPERPGQTVSIDVFGPLPPTIRANKYIVVLMDHFSKLVRCYPVPNQKLDTIVDVLEDRYFPEIGVPGAILSDNGSQFTAERWKQIGRAHGFAIKHASPYNPQSNPVERIMRELGRIIRVYAQHKHNIWDKVFPRAERVFNETEHRSTGYRPVDLHADQVETLEIDPRLIPTDRQEKDVLTNIQFAIEKLKWRAQERKKQADKKEVAPEYGPGVKVWIKVHKHSDKQKNRTNKLYPLYEGPYIIDSRVRQNAYLVEKLDGTKLGTYNSRQLRPHREAKFKVRSEEVNINMIRVREINVEDESVAMPSAICDGRGRNAPSIKTSTHSAKKYQIVDTRERFSD